MSATLILDGITQVTSAEKTIGKGDTRQKLITLEVDSGRYGNRQTYYITLAGKVDMEILPADQDEECVLLLDIEGNELVVHFCDERYIPGEDAVMHGPNAHPGSGPEVEYELCTGSNLLDDFLNDNYSDELDRLMFEWFEQNRGD